MVRTGILLPDGPANFQPVGRSGLHANWAEPIGLTLHRDGGRVKGNPRCGLDSRSTDVASDLTVRSDHGVEVVVGDAGRYDNFLSPCEPVGSTAG